MMEKPAEVCYPIHELLRQRWSPRAFSDRPVEPEKLLSLLEAARWAPSSYNEQPWSFIVATRDDPNEYDRVLSCLVEGNQSWAQQAPVLMLSIAKLNFTSDARPNRHALHDVGLATGSLIVQATALGLFVHQMAGIMVERAQETYAIPNGHEVVAAMALGYPNHPRSLPEKLRGREMATRTRKALGEFVFTGHWGRSSALVTPRT
jgi:nitroreductase